MPPRAGLELIETPEDARLLWMNELFTGVGKSSGGLLIEAAERGAERPGYGELDNLVVSDGIVFCTYTEPSGDSMADPSTIKHRYYRSQTLERIPRSAITITADQMTVAMDAVTGETLWTAREKGRAMNFLAGKRGHFGVSGAYGEGVFFTYSMMGYVFAYDAKTGEKKWEWKNEPWSRYAEQFRQQHVAARTIPLTINSDGFRYKRTGIVVADGVAVVPSLGGSLIGLDPRTGEELWRRGQLQMNDLVPTIWRHQGRTFLITVAPSSGKDGRVVRLVDPKDGSVRWEFESEGPITGNLISGEGYLLLNTRNDPPRGKKADYKKGDGILACYEITAEGLEEKWRFESKPEYVYRFRPDIGQHRRGAIREGVLYIKLGTGRDGVPHTFCSVDLETGRVLQQSHYRGIRGGTHALPYIVEDRLFWHIDKSHSGGAAGFIVFRLLDGGRFELLGKMKFTEFDHFHTTGYQHPRETPYYNGRFYLRGIPGIAALDVTAPPEGMFNDLLLHDAWSGYTKPLRVRLQLDETKRITAGRVYPPKHSELGIPLTTGYVEDARRPIGLAEPLKVSNQNLTGQVRIKAAMFDWDARLSLHEEDGGLTGVWTREIPGLSKAVTTRGDITGSGGHTKKVYPTPWLKHQPMSPLGSLEDGHQRFSLSLDRALPDTAKDTLKPLNLMLDHGAEGFSGGVGGSFSLNQAWHEVDTSQLRFNEGKITGQVIVILNPDPWMFPNNEHKTALVGRIDVDIEVAKGEGGQARGTYSARWGDPLVRQGRAEMRFSRNAN